MWIIKEEGYNQNNINHFGNKFVIGNLKLGIRGTLDEYTKEHFVALNLPLVYDQKDDLWRESINAFNPLYTKIYMNDVSIDVLNICPKHHEQSLNIYNSIHTRTSTFIIEGVEITLKSTRFVVDDERFIVSKFEIFSNSDVPLIINTGIDYDIWDQNGPHFKKISSTYHNDVLEVKGITNENKIVSVYKTSSFDNYQIKNIDSKNIFEKSIELKNGYYAFEQFSYIAVDEEEGLEKFKTIASKGYNELLNNHINKWEQKWNIADVKITGDEEAQLALRYQIYQLLILTPFINSEMSIPARGISGQTYKGAIFWDTEIFMLPFYLNVSPKSAKELIKYRINGLQEAINKANYYGYQGAFYAWESQENGFEACTDYNVVDVFTNRKVRTYFRDKQIHISGDIVYAINKYINQTKDYSILKDGALKVIFEVAKFYISYSHYNILKNQLEFHDVMGPDEYHERVNNNAFTNQLIKDVFLSLLNYISFFAEQDNEFLNDFISNNKYESIIDIVEKTIDKIYIPMPNENKIIEQFDGYFKFQDIKLKDLLKQKLHPDEYLGGCGLAGDTQIIKQADIITMLYLFENKYSKDIKEANFNYYEPRTEHGSTLSASMYALVACMIDKPNYAYKYFMKTATVDLTGKSKQFAGKIYIGGTHPAASGGTYLTAIFGFAGLDLTNLTLKNQLPDSIKSLTFKFYYQNKLYQAYVSKNKTLLEVIDND